jgi:putative phosphoribosyl transferase
VRDGVSAGVEERAVRVPAGTSLLSGDLSLPERAPGLVLFAHGSGSSRLSPRNRAVAAALQRRGLGTLLLDLLTRPEEEFDDRTGALRFDIEMLADRLVEVTRWLGEVEATRGLRIGYFGASTGGAAALMAAARLPEVVHAVVSRGGRPDLAGAWLARVEAPTLLIVGGEDVTVLDLNRRAFLRIPTEKSLHVIPGATHLFPEPGALEEVARVAGDWFVEHLVSARGAGAGNTRRERSR